MILTEFNSVFADFYSLYRFKWYGLHFLLSCQGTKGAVHA